MAPGSMRLTVPRRVVIQSFTALAVFPYPPHLLMHHYIIDLCEDTQIATDRLHLLHYAERFE